MRIDVAIFLLRKFLAYKDQLDAITPDWWIVMDKSLGRLGTDFHTFKEFLT